MDTRDGTVMPDSLWTVPQVARFLACSSTTVYRLSHEGILRAYQLRGGRLLYDPTEVRAALDRV
jgi:excisionase family DNA binding protein